MMLEVRLPHSGSFCCCSPGGMVGWGWGVREKEGRPPLLFHLPPHLNLPEPFPWSLVGRVGNVCACESVPTRGVLV